MALLRKFLHLEEYLQPIHFENLGKLLLTMSLLWFYFIFAERLTTWYGNAPSEMAVFWKTIRLNFAPLFWTMVVCNFIIPVPILAIKRFRTITGTAIARAIVVVGMWIERFLIIVPALEHKFLPYSWGHYRPTWVEDTLMASSFGFMALLYLLFSKFVPMISVWELKAGLQPHGGVPAPGLAAERPGLVLPGTLPTEVTGMKALYALYADPEAAQRAVDPCAPPAPSSGSMRSRSSSSPASPTMATNSPTSTPPRAPIAGPRSAPSLAARCGYLLTTLTQKSYPIPTGGMPLTPRWTNGIIVYEVHHARGHPHHAGGSAHRGGAAEFQRRGLRIRRLGRERSW